MPPCRKYRHCLELSPPAMATIVDPAAEGRRTARTSSHDLNGASAPRPSRACANGEFWRRSAPKRLRDGGASPHAAWKLYWNERQTPATVAALCRAATSPLAWALDRQSLPPGDRELLDDVDVLARGPSRRLKFAKGRRNGQLQSLIARWLEEARVASPGWELGIGCLAAAHALAELGGALDAQLGWELLDFLFATAIQAQDWNIADQPTAEVALGQQLLAGELPLTLAYYFPDMTPLAELRAAARDRLSEGVFELLNGEGLVRGPHLRILRPLAACWTRCRAIGGAWKRGCFSDVAERQYQALVRQAIRWSDPEGRPLLGGERSEPWPADFLKSVLHFGGRPTDVAAAQVLLGGRVLGKATKTAGQRLPKHSYQCEWATLALLRSDWSRDATILAVDYSARDMRLDLRLGRQRLLSGQCKTETQINGQTPAAVGPWSQVCWFSDKNSDYLEFALPLEGGARLERQFVLARREQFLLVMDSIQTDDVADLGHVWEAPLATGVDFRAEAETRDGVLASTAAPLARVLPLALPEWRIDPRVGDLSLSDCRLRLQQRTRARAMACPIFFDLSRQRAQQPCTWRQLTIAEWLVIQPPDVAVAYRAQSGDRQWVVYRSQAPRANRTFMGQNLSSEFLVARFLPNKGTVKTLAEVEG